MSFITRISRTKMTSCIRQFSVSCRSLQAESGDMGAHSYLYSPGCGISSKQADMLPKKTFVKGRFNQFKCVAFHNMDIFFPRKTGGATNRGGASPFKLLQRPRYCPGTEEGPRSNENGEKKQVCVGKVILISLKPDCVITTKLISRYSRKIVLTNIIFF